MTPDYEKVVTLELETAISELYFKLEAKQKNLRYHFIKSENSR